MSKDRRHLAADYVAALTEREYAEFVATAREQHAERGVAAGMRDFTADLFHPRPSGLSTIFNTDTEK